MSAQPKPDPNFQFLGTHSLQGGGDPSWVGRLYDAIADRLANRRKAKSAAGGMAMHRHGG
ncbi:hypothetical protein Dvina_33530 [Dactylosporangium vinaceum]|uniref:Uncharacterized protein n=1 Tax=Dactylosporangium vinaceum TaxID=53362 RepID=A0ABV5M9S7_9ACTN|nr:hypothetical protein [Dactylosporangium vinaceum]UAB93189.1 hypothetical protein Dvina_33530 [Dactylosporangium vinaceum]